MNPVTAVVQEMFEYGDKFLQVNYAAECGCRWVVDMWGNVRSVAVCRRCMKTPDRDQLIWDFMLGAESE